MTKQITQERLKELVHYDSETGIFIWKTKTSKYSHIKIDDIVGGINKKSGYIQTRIDGKKYQLHRLIWLYMYGYMPKQIDHINQARADNRICNLREVNNQDNHKNRTRNINNTSSVTGVSWHKRIKKWSSQITINGKQIHLGYFIEFHKAVDIRKNHEALYGFHKNHGKGK